MRATPRWAVLLHSTFPEFFSLGGDRYPRIRGVLLDSDPLMHLKRDRMWRDLMNVILVMVYERPFSNGTTPSHISYGYQCKVPTSVGTHLHHPVIYKRECFSRNEHMSTHSRFISIHTTLGPRDLVVGNINNKLSPVTKCS